MTRKPGDLPEQVTLPSARGVPRGGTAGVTDYVIVAREKVKYSICAVFALAFAGASSLSYAATLDDIVVSANRTPTKIEKIGSSVTVLTTQDIEKSGASTVLELLTQVPGFSMTQTGGAGQVSTINLRGNYGRYIKVLVDGIDISDASSPQPMTELAWIPLADVERVEVLRGSQSGLYGSGAIGGVIDITTKRAKSNGVHHNVAVEAGSYGTGSGTYNLSAGSATGGISATLSQHYTSGFSAADARKGNGEDDSAKQQLASLSGYLPLNDQFRFEGSLRHVKNAYEYDNGFGPNGPQDSLVNHANSTVNAGRISLVHEEPDGSMENRLSFQLSNQERHDFNSSFSEFNSDRQKIDYVGRVSPDPSFDLSYGADLDQSSMKVNSYGSEIRADADIWGVFLQGSFTPIENLTLTATLRHDEHSEFGNHTTGRTTIAYQPMAGTKLHASYGTGFRAPSLYELYAPFYGNKNLQPETSKSLDIGVDQAFLDNKLTTGVTWFQSDITNEIGFTSTYAQVPGTSKRQGVELTSSYEINDWLGLTAGYTYTQAKDRKDKRLIRVPRNNYQLGVQVMPATDVTLNLRGQYQTDRWDQDQVTFANVPMPDVFLLGATATYQLQPGTQIYLRGENLTNAHYQSSWGYGTAGASAYIGLRTSF